jgi:hypothetical protein
MSKNDFIQKANAIHNNKYTYDNCVYVNARTNIIITCSIHGDFTQLPCHSFKRTRMP